MFCKIIFSFWDGLQDINFNIVPITDTDKPIVSAEAQYLSDVSWQMSRADVARFMLDCLQEETDKSKCLAVGVK